MLTPSDRSLRALCRQRIALARRAAPNGFVPPKDRVVQIVRYNLDAGRFSRFAAQRAQKKPLTPAQYVDIVLHHFCREHTRVALLEQADPTEWERLRALLARRAYRIVNGFGSGTQVWAEACDFASETCLIIFEARYPFDIAFEAWATTILRHLILARYTRSTDALDRAGTPISLDAPVRAVNDAGDPPIELLADDQSAAPFEKIENQSVLLNAIAQLSPLQRQVIEGEFLHQWDDAQIARRLGKSKQAVYNLRHRALLRLREILARQNAPQEHCPKKHQGK
jgi:RNA polymerase sigma factor (sigma-70 family)